MNLIVAVDHDWAIGRKGDLLYHIPSDLKYFKEKTSGNTIIMGRSTLKSFPGGKPLPSRNNIVLTRNKDLPENGFKIMHSVEETLSYLKAEQIPYDSVFVVGGGTIYKTFLPYCNTAYITKIGATVDDSDTFFPNLDALPDWETQHQSEPVHENGLNFAYYTYKRK